MGSRMINSGGSKRIRERALRDYVEPAIRSKRDTVTIRIKELMKKLESEGFPSNRPAQFCSALQERGFLQEHGLVVDRVEGPPSGKSTTVVLHMRIEHPHKAGKETQLSDPAEEDPHVRAARIVGKLQGLLKKEIAEYGGAEGFMRWVRSEDEL